MAAWCAELQGSLNRFQHRYYERYAPLTLTLNLLSFTPAVPQRLEFLGDAVLDALVTTHFYTVHRRVHDGVPRGSTAVMRSLEPGCHACFAMFYAEAGLTKRFHVTPSAELSQPSPPLPLPQRVHTLPDARHAQRGGQRLPPRLCGCGQQRGAVLVQGVVQCYEAAPMLSLAYLPSPVIALLPSLTLLHQL